MTKLFVVSLLVLTAVCGVSRAEDEAAPAPLTQIVGHELPPPRPDVMSLASPETFPGGAPKLDFANFRLTNDFSATSAGLAFAKPGAFALPAEPSPSPAAPEPRFVFGGRDDFRWQLGLGISLLRFRSNFYYATGVGTDTSLTYYTNEWFGLEGRVTTSFAPTISRNENVKYLGYGGGPKIAWRTQRFEPFVHGIFGGAHVLPRLAVSGPNAVAFQAGGGAGYRFNPRLSARVVVDYVRTHFFGQWQNNAQGTLEAVLHF